GDERGSDDRAKPELPRRPLLRHQGGGRGGRERQDAEDDAAVRGFHVPHRPGSEQGKSHDDTERDYDERFRFFARGHALAGREEKHRREERRSYRATETDEHRIEGTHRGACCRKRHREECHREEAEQVAEVLVARLHSTATGSVKISRLPKGSVSVMSLPHGCFSMPGRANAYRFAFNSLP